jgi:penicillin-binding protein 2
MKKAFLILLTCIFLFVACKPTTSTAPAVTSTPGITPPANQTLPAPVVDLTPAPNSIDAANSFLTNWQDSNYSAMYALLNGASRDAHTEDDFTKIYQNAAYDLTLQNLDYSILSSLTYPTSAQIAYHVKFQTNLLGVIERDIQMNLSLEGGQWKVLWDEGLIMPELRGGNHLKLDVQFPSRANIYDRNGQMIATNTDAYALGIVPADIGDGQEGELVYQLSKLTDLTQSTVRAMYQDANPNWYVAIGEASAQAVQDRYDTLSQLSGLQISEYSGRFYYSDGIAPQVTGYLLGIFPEQLDEYRRKGYAGDEKIGAAGIEKWGEQYLAGSPSASLYVVTANGDIVTRVVQKDPTPSQDIYTTFDKDLQIDAQRALLGLTGAIVVLERNTGRVLAMASSPDIDPNLFEPTNRNNSEVLATLLNDGSNRLLNRATQSSFPLGSVFKIVVMAAALESGLYTAKSTLDCQYEFTELPDVTLYDWTYTKKVAPSGMLTLPEGLMRSCDPWFYHLGLDLFRKMGDSYMTNMALGFGLGSATGIGQVAEETGSIPKPTSDREAVQQGIGQGTMLVTPIQVADFIAAVGNGGTLYRPQIIEKIVKPNGTATYQFEPEVRGTLPVKQENLKIIQDAMYQVVENVRGTAHRALAGLGLPLYGKTGTAQNPDIDPHAWFVGYTNTGSTSKPDIAVVVFIQNGGEGSEKAAPVFRRIIESYYGMTWSLYPWESSYFVTRTPTPEGMETPTP